MQAKQLGIAVIGSGRMGRLRASLARTYPSVGFVGGCLFGNTALEASDTNPAFAALVTEVFAEWVARVETRLREAQALGQVRRDLAANPLAELLVATVEGGIMQARLQKCEGPLAKALDSLRVLLGLPAPSGNGRSTH
jgi:TetR/AcrR family transcriptional repressor of nem operon